MTERLAEMSFAALTRPVVSTVTGAVLESDVDVRTLLRDQVLEPVRFHEAAARAVEGADLVIEAGPGRVLAGLVGQISPDTRVLSVDTDNASLGPLLTVIGAAFAAGVAVDPTVLFARRGIKPLPVDAEFSFLTNPCETAPELSADVVTTAAAAAPGAPAIEPEAQAGAEQVSTIELLRKLAAERVELPLEAVSADTHPLDDLHLSSITVGQLVNEVTKELGRPPLTATPNFATVRIGELAEIIDQLADTAHEQDAPAQEAPGVAAWVRPFAVTHVERPHPPAEVGSVSAAGQWSVFAPEGHPLAEPLTGALSGAGLGDGVLLCLPADCDETHVGLFLDAARAALTAPRLVVVQQGLGASGLARTLHLENPSTTTTIVELPEVTPAGQEDLRLAVTRVVTEARATNGFAEVRYDAEGRRLVPVLNPVTPAESGQAQLGADDVLLVTGGGKGITAESALAIVADTGAGLGLLGRSDPAEDTELAANLARLDAAGVRYRYAQADVTSPEAVSQAVTEIQNELGDVTAVLHGAGRNEPEGLATLSEETFRRTLAPKITGLRTVLDAVDGDKIKLLVTFGSIIGRAGLRGEAHYATANDWMTELTVRFQREHPAARVLALEWSVWSGAGMGERLGVVEALMRDGITPISTDSGLELLRKVLADPSAGPVLVMSGRSGDLPTLTLERPSLPLLRFVDRVKAYYPGIELVTEADLAPGSDPYLSDHEIDGDLLFPAVLSMEAMTQVASVLSEDEGRPLLENMEFLRPIVVRPDGQTTVRIAALVTAPGVVDVVIRSEETGFGTDHFRATLRWPRPELPAEHHPVAAELPAVPVDPAAELYGGLMFQGKRFQRLIGYRRANARHAVAEIAASPQPGWFATFVPQDMLLADPGTRDVAMHALQCCVPDATLLPERIERLYLTPAGGEQPEYVVLDAREREQDGDSYTYDVDLSSPSGTLLERWEGLTLRAVRKNDGSGPWVPSMLGSYLERTLERVLGGSRAVVVEPDPADAEQAAGGTERRAQTQLAMSRALGRPVELRYRPDGKPETEDATVSASHGEGLTMAIAGAGRLACDVEAAVDRSDDDWAALLGAAQLPARDLLRGNEEDAVANTRVWAALECLRKAGATTQALTVGKIHDNRWVLLSAGDTTVATWVTRIEGRPDPIVFAVLTGKEGR